MVAYVYVHVCVCVCACVCVCVCVQGEGRIGGYAHMHIHICIHIQAHAQYRCVHYMHELVEKRKNNRSLCRREKWVLSFGIKEQSEEECLTVRGRRLTSDMIVWLLQWQFRTVTPAVCAFYWDFTDRFKVMVLMIAVWFSSCASPAFQCHVPQKSGEVGAGHPGRSGPSGARRSGGGIQLVISM